MRLFTKYILCFGTFLTLACLMSVNCYADKYYVDNINGNDNNDGKSQISPICTFDKLEAISLKAGDTVLFAKGRIFDAVLTIKDSGSSSGYIVLSSYGDRNADSPIFTNTNIQDGFGNCIILRGSNIIVEKLKFSATLSNIAKSHPIDSFTDMWKLGAIHIDSRANSCIVRNNEFVNCGVGIKSNGNNIIISNNYLHHSTQVLKQWNWGPIAIWIGGDNQEICYNVIQDYRAENDSIIWRTSGKTGADGSAIEIDDGRRSKHNIKIHHNVSQGCQGFIEVTFKDVISAPDYSNFEIFNNISDDYQQFLLLWQGRNCTIRDNTIIRRKRNGNEQGVFRITQAHSYNKIISNNIITADSIYVFKNAKNTETQIENNKYLSLGSKIYKGNETLGKNAQCFDSVENFENTKPQILGREEKQNSWFNKLNNIKSILSTDYIYVLFDSECNFIITDNGTQE